jgi:hypothetical protein
MNDTYFFGKRMNLNQGGRVNFSNGGPGFYNQADQELYAGGLQYLPQEQYRLNLGNNNQVNRLDFNNLSNSGITSQAPASYVYPPINQTGDGGGGKGPPGPDDDDDDEDTSARGRFGIGTLANVLGFVTNPFGFIAGKVAKKGYDNYKDPYKNIFGGLNKDTRDAISRENEAVDKQGLGPGPGKGNTGAAGIGSGYNEGNYCFDPSTPIQMANGSSKEIKNIQLGDQTKGGEVTGVFQFKASNEIYDYKGVTVAGSHYVKEDDKFIMVKDSPLAVKIDKIPVVYSLDTTGRRIFINDIEFADYNGDGVAKNFLTNAGVDLTGFDKEVLRQVEHRLI